MKVRFWLALIAELLLFAALNLFGDWTSEAMPHKFVVAAILAGLAYLIAASEFGTVFPSDGDGDQHPPRASAKVLGIFWVVTITLRLLALPLPPSDELARGQADGQLQRVHLNPYFTAPAQITTRSLARADEPTAFAPATELVFRGLSAHRPLLGKILFGAAELLATALLLKLLGARAAAWFAWNPLVAYSFVGAAHFDALFILALVALIYSLEQGEIRRWSFAAALSLGIAIAFRPFALVLLLPSAFALRRRAWSLILALFVPLLLAAVFGNPRALFTNFFGDFSTGSRLNDLFWWLIEETVASNYHQRLFRYDLVIMVVASIIALIYRRNWRRGLFYSLAAVVILAPALHAWYVVWILPFATWRRAHSWHVLSVTIFAYYLFFNERLFALPWHAEPWLRGVIILPVLFSLMSKAWTESRVSSPLPA